MKVYHWTLVIISIVHFWKDKKIFILGRPYIFSILLQNFTFGLRYPNYIYLSVLFRLKILIVVDMDLFAIAVVARGMQ